MSQLFSPVPKAYYGEKWPDVTKCYEKQPYQSNMTSLFNVKCLFWCCANSRHMFCRATQPLAIFAYARDHGAIKGANAPLRYFPIHCCCAVLLLLGFLKKFRNHKLCKRLQNVIKLLTKQIIWYKKIIFQWGGCRCLESTSTTTTTCLCSSSFFLEARSPFL